MIIRFFTVKKVIQILNYLPKPKSSFLQWHITERCNLRCKHCYQTSYETPEMPLPKMLSIVDEYVELLDAWNINGRMQVTGCDNTPGICDTAVAGKCIAKQTTETNCADGLDNDCDGKIDDFDSDCGQAPPTSSDCEQDC